MYRVEWLDFDGEIKIMRGFKTSEEAHEWIRTHNFDMDFEIPMVFYGDLANKETFVKERKENEKK